MRLCPRCGVQITTTHDEVAADVPKTETFGEDKLETSLVRALDDEIEYIRKEGGSRFHQIRNGEMVTEVAGSFVYKFDFDGDRLETDVPVLLQIGDSKNRVEAEIISVVGQEIMLAVKSKLPDAVPKAKMFTDPIFILERLRNLIKSPPPIFNKALAHRLLGEDQPKLGRVPIGGPSELNESQISAVENSAGSEVFFIWGPPGTGKTKTISSVISHCFAAGGRVLITSNTNVAVDNAISNTEKLIHKDIHRDDSNASPGDIVRVGVP
jgi:Cdc6-like AAA superfamily ATPase